MRIEDINIEHVRRGAVVKIYKGEDLYYIGIPVSIEDTKAPVYAPQEILHDTDCYVARLAYSYVPSTMVPVGCEGECAPRKPEPWGETKYVHIRHTLIVSWKYIRTIIFADGRREVFTLKVEEVERDWLDD